MLENGIDVAALPIDVYGRIPPLWRQADDGLQHAGQAAYVRGLLRF